MYEETKDAVKHPRQVVKALKKATVESAQDIDDVMADIKEGAMTLQSEVNEVMKDLAEDSIKCIEVTSKKELLEAEAETLNGSGVQYKILDVEVDKKKMTYNTVCFDSRDKYSKLPLVMVHGMGGGIPCYYKNYHHFCQNRNIYGIDIPGFAQSSRIEFSTEIETCLEEMVAVLEKWREAMDINKFILLGHSFGGYLSFAYAVKNPDRLEHLILTDPWGIIPKEEDSTKEDPELWQKAAMSISHLMKSNPFSIIRQTGPLGPILNDRFLPDEIRDAYGDKGVKYFFHAIAQEHATGETAFSVLSDYQYIWPAKAMKYPLTNLSSSVPITFIYGEKSPYHNTGGASIEDVRYNVFIPPTVSGAGHHLQAERPDEFNKLILDILSKCD